MLNIAVCVSGGGTNLQAILDGIEQGEITNTRVAAVISNNPGAYALERAENHGIEGVCISPKQFPDRESFNRAFLEKLDTLRQLAEGRIFSFTRQELERYLEDYVKSGCVPLSHSPAYRAAYRPAYRVVKRSHSLVALAWELERLRDRGEGAVVAIDGRCASGKSSLAGCLGERLGVPVVHMDDFFLRPEQRTRERLSRPGENVDHERFLEEVLAPLRAGRAAAYRPWSCRTGELGDPVTVEPGTLVLVEGSYSCHPELWEHYARRVFLSVEPEEQLRRIAERDGAEQLKNFRERWIPLEEKYFSAFQVEDRCDYQLEA